MLPKGSFKKFAAVGLVAAAIAPAGAAARPAIDGVPASATPAASVQDLRAPDQAAPSTGSQPPVVSAAPTWPVHPQTLTPPKAAASSDGGIDTGVIIALSCLGLVGLLGAGYLYRVHTHGPRRATA
jgi:hypothetical protein